MLLKYIKNRNDTGFTPPSHYCVTCSGAGGHKHRRQQELKKSLYLRFNTGTGLMCTGKQNKRIHQK